MALKSLSITLDGGVSDLEPMVVEYLPHDGVVLLDGDLEVPVEELDDLIGFLSLVKTKAMAARYRASVDARVEEG